MKLHLAALFIVVFSSAAMAQPLDRALLVSDITSADMLIAKAAAQKSGAPVFVLENGTLTDDVAAELADMNIRTVILIGGPAVIDNKTEDALSRYTVIRLWGSERTGTAIEVAKYFWTEAECAVLADDTKDSEADTELQASAAQIAAADNCVYMPVPRGKVPSSVVELLSDLNIGSAKLVGTSPGEFRSKLPLINRTEIGEADREKMIIAGINRTGLRLIVAAAPHWKYAMSIGGIGGRDVLVKIVSSADTSNLTRIIDEQSITDVRVVGHPGLAAEIASNLALIGINTTKISGERASETAIKVIRNNIDEWQKRRTEAFGNETKVTAKSKIKRQVNRLLSELESELNSLEAGIAAETNAAAILKNRIDNAQAQLGAVRDYITNDNLDTAKKRISRLQNDVRKIRWLYRMELNVDSRDDVAAEES